MRKFTAIILSVFLTMSLAACGGGGASQVGSGVSTPDPLTGEIAGEITVSAYDSMTTKAFLEDAARLFEEKYPGTKVNVETFSAMPEIRTAEQGNMRMQTIELKDDPQARQDYINKINTALMSGKGADVLAMDVLPVHKLVDGGQLENLAAYMESDPDFNRDDYRGNILDAISYKNGTWFMPLDYSFNYYAYDSTLLTGATASGFGMGSAFTVDELMEKAQPEFDGSVQMFNLVDYVGGPRGANDMWGSLLGQSYASFVDIEGKSAHFDDGRFEALLESVKRYSEEGYIPEGMTGQMNPETAMQRIGGGAPVGERFFFKDKNIFTLTNQFTRDLGMRSNIMMAGGVMAIEDDDEIAGIKANADGGVPFTYDQAYAINSNSPNKETAWAFIRFLLSEEMQLNSNLMMPTALPILNTARAKKAETILSGAFGPRRQEGTAEPEPLSDKQLEALAKYNEAVESMSDLINAYVLEDTVVNDMIDSEVAYFFDGSKTASEVAGTLQSKVDLYLNE